MPAIPSALSLKNKLWYDTGQGHQFKVLRTETGALAGSVFEPAAKDAPGQPQAEEIPQHHTGKPLLQRFCTRARMRLRHAGAARRMALLSHDEPLREAFDLDIPSDFFITILTQDSSARA